MENQRKRLLDLFSRLGEADRNTVLALAQFLAERASPASQEVPEPRAIPRPREESVIAAIRRLSNSYAMLDRGEMLGETSGLLSEHVLQGRSAAEVIDDLEAVFKRRYEGLRRDRRLVKTGNTEP